MLAGKVSIFFLVVVTVVGDETCDVAIERPLVDDDTVLLQNELTVLAGNEKPKDHGKAKADEKPKDHEKAKAHEKPKAHKAKSAPAVAKPTMFKKALAEFLAMTLFVFIGCGSAMAVANVSGFAWVLHVSLSFGLAITVLAYTIGHYSGGQINCAVTLGLIVSGHVTVGQGALNVAAQLLGSVCGSFITFLIFGKSAAEKQDDEVCDKTRGLGCNSVNPKFTPMQAFLAEIMGTFLLVYVVHETAVNPATTANRALACLAIGLSVFLAHSVMIPIDGCSINPTRTFGPAVVQSIVYGGEKKDSPFKDFWVFVVGPCLGGVLAALVYRIMSA